MLNRKGLTMIELIAAVIIVGLILLFAFPVLTNLTINNNSRKFDYYYEAIKKSSLTYAETLTDVIGGSDDEGCYTVSIDYLIKRGYISLFDDSKITCDGKVRIKNNGGQINTYVNISCKDSNAKEVFNKNEFNNSDTCIAYSPQGDLSIYESIKNNNLNGATVSYDNQKYVVGNNPNNYVYYSGKMWRIISYSDTTGENGYVKIISEDVITTLPYLYGASSDIYNWFNESLVDTLKMKDTYLQNITWRKSNDTTKGYIGLLSNAEVNKIRNSADSYIDSTKGYLIINASSNGNVYNQTSGSPSIINKDIFTGIRSVVALKATTIVTHGNGTINSPYRLSGDSGNARPNTLLNTRYSGEYISLEGETYRIVRISNGTTKIISTSPSFTISFDEDGTNYLYNDSSLYSTLDSWYKKQTVSFRNMVIEGTWCTSMIASHADLSSICPYTTKANIGIPEISEIYTSVQENENYDILTMNYPDDDSRINIITSSESINTQALNVVRAKTKISLFLNSYVYITSGNGTESNPFIISNA